MPFPETTEGKGGTMRMRGGGYRRAAGPKPTTIDLAGDWRACTDTLPRGCEVLGTVTNNGDTGALVKLAGTGNFVMVRDGKNSILMAATIERLLESARNKRERPEMIPIEEWEAEQ